MTALAAKPGDSGLLPEALIFRGLSRAAVCVIARDERGADVACAASVVKNVPQGRQGNGASVRVCAQLEVLVRNRRLLSPLIPTRSRAGG